MRLRSALKNAALARSVNHSVQDVRIGLCYTAVRLDNGQLGLAYTFRDCVAGGCTPLGENRRLAGLPASSLIALFDQDDPISSALALATANALFNTDNPTYRHGPSLAQLQFLAQDRVGMIGNFAPLVREIRPLVHELNIFERQKRLNENILAIEAADDILPRCQVALITATAIINDSIDHLLSLTAHCREVVILGSSTPLLSDPFNNTPVTLLSGIRVTAPKEILQIVSEGGGTPAFKQAVEKVNLNISSV